MSGTAPKTKICWERPRLIASWIVWLVALLMVFQPSGGFAGMILIVAAGLLRPRTLWVWNERQLLKTAIVFLIAIPLVAYMLGSESALSFMYSPSGTALIVATWILDTALDFSSYQRLQPIR
jgi:hypothetical protein